MTGDGWTRTTCPYCGVGCGVLARPRDDGTAEIKGDPAHPANFGRLCSKGLALGETLSLDDRLLAPAIEGSPASWDDALDLVARRFAQTIREHGPDSVALYVSGQILTEDYYVANKLMKGFIGSANIDTNSRLCMASSVAGHKRAFGSDTVPGCYEDLELADLVVLVGSNLAWCHPVLYQRLLAARERRGTKIVVIDPRETATCDEADDHLAIAPGSDVALFNGLLAYLAESGAIDHTYLTQNTTGFETALVAAKASGDRSVAEITELPPAELAAFYALYAGTERVVTVYSQGVNQSAAGTDKVNAIINCHLATGRLGRPGMGPFSVTGQPNAMGGRETGGLANMLAAHMELSDPEHRRIVRAFWRAPHVASAPGLKAVELFRAVGEGRIKAVWIMGTNPTVSMPEADAVADALSSCPFVVVSDVLSATETTGYADVLLPAAAWGEKDGTVTNSERRISRQRAFLSLPGEARPDWWHLAEVARRMGFGDAFGWRNASEIFAEYAGLTAFENGGTRDLDLGALEGITQQDYDALQPFQWPRPAGARPAESRFFADGGFFTADRRARLVATPFRSPAQRTSARYPFILNTGRLRDHWHTMTRTAKSARLMAHAPEPVVEVNPRDADRLGLMHAELAEIESGTGRAILRVAVTDAQKPGSLFAPMHWSAPHARPARIGALIGASTDPVSGQPELKHAAVRLSPFAARWHAFAVSRARPSTAHAAVDYAAVARTQAGYRCELAGTHSPDDWDTFAREVLQVADRDAEVLHYRDAKAGHSRFAAFAGGRLEGAVFVSPRPLTLSRSWLADLIGRTVPGEDRFRILAGRPGEQGGDRGPTVCACMDVGRDEIVAAIASGRATSVAEIGQCTAAGTSCGSCRSQIRRILEDATLENAG
ncbi:MAG: molybdopterin-dependent oxidoreductase [Hyphomicrobiaceae bacterium]